MLECQGVSSTGSPPRAAGTQPLQCRAQGSLPAELCPLVVVTVLAHTHPHSERWHSAAVGGTAEELPVVPTLGMGKKPTVGPCPPQSWPLHTPS